MTTTEFLKSLNLQDKIIKSAKLTLKKIYLETQPAPAPAVLITEKTKKTKPNSS
jgi:hypothetical protein